MPSQEDLINQLRETYKKVFESNEGAIVMKDIENRCGYNTSTFSKESSHETAFLEGQRAVVLFIKSMLTRPPMKKEKK
tara:strand:+ start:386 stop:619 length:234 start_codon:yes stop_codon:yes gene_type:complete